uniref:WGS project CBMI000000000 data, contig CS3069_c003376 n=1 Tax=Fusarium clavum TaxID=2594811 RepID=A0A090N5W8_9HYPO|nr:unnamed protein product [Fusarium clavum]
MASRSRKEYLFIPSKNYQLIEVDRDASLSMVSPDAPIPLRILLIHPWVMVETLSKRLCLPVDGLEISPIQGMAILETFKEPLAIQGCLNTPFGVWVRRPAWDHFGKKQSSFPIS